MTRVVEDRRYGYRRLDPIPQEPWLKEYYESQYYEILRNGKRGMDIHRLLKGGPNGDKERAWFRSTLYADVHSVLKDYWKGEIRNRRLLDVGCGTGDFLLFMREKGWKVVGLELSSEARRMTRRRRLNVHALTVGEFLSQCPAEKGRFDVVSMFHVLEHLPDPVKILQGVKRLLSPLGVVVVQVPNDFNVLQKAAHRELRGKPWWVVTPDHINYFDFASLKDLFRRIGLRTFHAQGDFPMELFLLMGRDTNYVGNPAVGTQCHFKRIRLESSLPNDLRRTLYCSLAQLGIGRNCLIFGSRREDPGR